MSLTTLDDQKIDNLKSQFQSEEFNLSNQWMHIGVMFSSFKANNFFGYLASFLINYLFFCLYNPIFLPESYKNLATLVDIPYSSLSNNVDDASIQDGQRQY